MTFSKECRTTLNGIAAASGKAGALLGTVIFAPAATTIGQPAVMVACAILSSLGMMVTLFCVPETLLEKDDENEIVMGKVETIEPVQAEYHTMV